MSTSPSVAATPFPGGPGRPGLLPPNRIVAATATAAPATPAGVADIPALSNTLSWPVRDQGDHPTCTAFAAIACLELIRALHGRSGVVTQLSASFLYFYMLRQAAKENFDGEVEGFTRFEDAKFALSNTGICNAAIWPDESIGVQPDPAATTAGAADVVTAVDINIESYPPGSVRTAGLADRIYAQLAQQRPVGIGIPAYTRPNDPGWNNWTAAFDNGVVLEPGVADILDKDSGHAVCVVGFTGRGQQLKRVLDGYFIFRNSLGLQFAANPVSDLPGPGYGLISASQVEARCWDVFLLNRNMV